VHTTGYHDGGVSPQGYHDGGIAAENLGKDGGDGHHDGGSPAAG
jgi:hypothetical protein